MTLVEDRAGGGVAAPFNCPLQLPLSTYQQLGYSSVRHRHQRRFAILGNRGGWPGNKWEEASDEGREETY